MGGGGDTWMKWKMDGVYGEPHGLGGDGAGRVENNQPAHKEDKISIQIRRCCSLLKTCAFYHGHAGGKEKIPGLFMCVCRRGEGGGGNKESILKNAFVSCLLPTHNWWFQGLGLVRKLSRLGFFLNEQGTLGSWAESSRKTCLSLTLAASPMGYVRVCVRARARVSGCVRTLLESDLRCCYNRSVT